MKIMNGVAVVSHWSMRGLIGSVFQAIGVCHLSESPTAQDAHATWKKEAFAYFHCHVPAYLFIYILPVPAIHLSFSF